MELSVEPFLAIPTRSVALALEFSPFEWSQSLLAVGHSSSIAVYSVKFKEEVSDDEDDGYKGIKYELLWECHISNEPVCISWSPKSTLRAIDKCLQILVGTTSHSVIQLTSNMKKENLVQEVSEHKDCINSITYSGDAGDLLAASTGDDLVVKVWNCETNQLLAKFLLNSPGISVKFHPEDPDLLLVGERSGTLRLYSVSNLCAKIALRNPSLLSADWSLSDPSLIVASGPQGVFVWNISNQQPSRVVIKVGGGDCVSRISLCRSMPDIAASVSVPNTLRIFNISTNKVPVAAHLKVVSDVTWHLQYPYLAVACDCKILFWRSRNV